MKTKILIGSALMLLLFACASGSVFAYDVNDTATAQSTISNATSNSVVSFDPNGNYSGFTVNVPSTAQNLTLNGNGATVSGDGINHIFVINNAVGFSLYNFNIIANSQNGIRGNNTVGFTMSNCTISDGSAGVNLFGASSGFTIVGNTITNMTVGNGNGISLVHHSTLSNLSSLSPSTIANNTISDVNYGMFIGGNFLGTIDNNDITDASIAGIQFAGKMASTNGKVNVTISNNFINSTGIGLDLLTPNFLYLNLNSNDAIQGDTSCVEIGPLATFNQLLVNNNEFFGDEGDLENLFYSSEEWDNNFLNGIEYP